MLRITCKYASKLHRHWYVYVYTILILLWIKQNWSENQKYRRSVIEKYIVEEITLNSWKY